MTDQLTGRLVSFAGPGKPLQLETHPVRPLQPGEILVRNTYTTLCGSDLHTYCGLREEPCPTVLGHEIIGEVTALYNGNAYTDLKGNVLRPGDLVTWTVFSSDPQSFNSLRGIPQKGDGLFKYGHVRIAGAEVFHGGLGEYCILKAGTGIIRLSGNMPASVAATLNCSVSTVAGALRVAGNVSGKNILITGMGHLGITCAAMCREAGAAWIAAADITGTRLKEALRFGAHETFDMNGDLPALQKTLRERTPGRGIDVAFDMSGSPDAMEFGIGSLGIGGTAVLIGAVFNTRPLQIDPQHVIRNLLSIKGLHNYNFEDFQSAFDFMENNWEKYPFSGIVEKEFPLTAAQEAFEYARAYKPLRVGIKL